MCTAETAQGSATYTTVKCYPATGGSTLMKLRCALMRKPNSLQYEASETTNKQSALNKRVRKPVMLSDVQPYLLQTRALGGLFHVHGLETTARIVQTQTFSITKLTDRKTSFASTEGGRGHPSFHQPTGNIA